MELNVRSGFIVYRCHNRDKPDGEVWVGYIGDKNLGGGERHGG